MTKQSAGENARKTTAPLLTFAALVVAATLASAPVWAQLPTPYLVHDAWTDDHNTGRYLNVSFPDGIWWQDRLLFTEHDPQAGVELWSADRAGRVALLADLCPGYCHGNPRGFTIAGGRVYFSANDGEHGVELWSTDGTATGTRMVADLLPGEESSSPIRLLEHDGEIYFHTLGRTGRLLWRSDGTAKGTVPLMGASDGHRDFASTRHGVVKIEEDLTPYLFAIDPAGGPPELLAVLGSSQASASGFDWPSLAGVAYFVVTDWVPGEGRQRFVWRTDGTASGTWALDTPVRVSSSVLRQAGSRIVGLTDEGVFVIEGTRRHYELPIDFQPDCVSLRFPLRKSSTLAGVLFQCGKALWYTDGTRLRTRKIDESATPHLRNFAPFAGGVLFDSRRSDGGGDIWFTDGTAKGTHIVLADHSLSATLDGFDGPLSAFFTGFSFDLDLWLSDGTAFRTRKVWPTRDQSSSYLRPVAALGTQRHLAQSTFSYESFVLETGQPAVSVDTATDLETKLFDGPSVLFQGRWFIDGSRPGSPTIGPSRFNEAQSVDDNLRGVQEHPGGSLTRFEDFLVISSPSAGWLTLSDSSGSATSVGASPAVPPTTFGFRAPYLRRALFERWRPLETEDHLFLPGRQGLQSLDRSGNLTIWDDDIELNETFGVTSSGRVFFSSSHPRTGREIVSLDPQNGRLQAHEVVFGATSSVARPSVFPFPESHLLDEEHLRTKAFWAAAGELFFFAANDGVHGTELWATDGTGDPFLVRDIEPGPGSSFPDAFRVVGGRLFFRARDSTHGNELWTSNGTLAGTQRLLDARPGPASALPQGLLEVDDRLLFTLYDEDAGRELWMSDGTPQGTVRFPEIAPGPGSSSPMEFLVMDDRVLFTANDGERGHELWAVDRPIRVNPDVLFKNGFESRNLQAWDEAEP